MKLSCNLIVRDESSTLEQLLRALRPHVDELVIIDTGSTDATPDIARRYADRFEVFLACNDEQGRIDDFSSARNRALELSTGDAVCWFDGDDAVDGIEHLRGLLDRIDTDNAIFLVPYEYAYDDAGRCVVLHSRERLVYPRHRFEWRWPVHECLVPVEPVEGTIRSHAVDTVRVRHLRQRSRKVPEPGRNLRILRAHFDRVGESDVRALYYLGIEYGTHGDIGNAFRFLKRYVELAGSFHVCPGWPDEKCLAELEIAKLYQSWGDDQNSLLWADQAKRTKSWAEPYWVAGKTYFALAMAGFDPEYNFRRACHQFQVGWDLRSADTVLFSNPQERPEVHLWWNQALYRLGEIDAAISSCEEGLRSLSGAVELEKNLETYRKLRAVRTIEQQADYLVSTGALDAAQRKVLGYLAAGKVDLQLVRSSAPAAERVTEQAAAPGKLDLVFFLGEAWERWNPDTLRQVGIGGSETMAWEMARRLRANGHRVRVYGHCLPTQEGVFDGVEWYDSHRFRGVTCDVLIASRRPDAVDDSFGCQAGARVLWVHDVHCGEEFTAARNIRIDRILCLSNWHKAFFLSCYRGGIDPDKVIVTRNGIDLKRFEQQVERNPHRAIYSSSPDRGLLTALECWPRIRERVPDAELHVYYGFNNWEKANPQDPNIRTLKHLLRTTAGVVMHGRVNQDELARAMLGAGVWAYPTWWTETSCITAMEAQAAGLRIVTSPIAALVETVGDRGAMIGGDWREPDYMERWSHAVVEAICANWSRSELQRYAREHFGLDALAIEWDAMLAGILDDVRRDVVPRFYAGAAAE